MNEELSYICRSADLLHDSCGTRHTNESLKYKVSQQYLHYSDNSIESLTALQIVSLHLPDTIKSECYASFDIVRSDNALLSNFCELTCFQNSFSLKCSPT